MRFKFLLCAILFAVGLNAQIYEPVTWKMTSEKVSDTEYDLVFTATMEKGWTIYSQFTDDNGPVPTYFEFDAGDHFTKEGKVAESGKKKEGPDPLFDNVVVIKYIKSPVKFTQRVKVTDASKPIVGYLEFMTCDSERCLPPTSVDFSFDLAEATAKDEVASTNDMEASTDDKEPSQISERTVDADDKGQAIAGQEEESDVNLIASDKMENPVTWSFSHKKLSDTEYELTFKADLEEGWTLPSLFTSEEDGPIPTYYYWEEGAHYELAADMTEEGKKKEAPDPLFDNAMVIKFIKGPVVFKQKVKVNDINTPIKGEIEFTSCDDEKCLTPQLVNYVFNLNGEAVASNTAGALLPGDGSSINQTRETIRSTYEAPVGDCGVEDVARDTNLLWTFVLGFLGGLVALLTPCVFPMIPLTVSFFTKSSEEKGSGIRNALIYGLSIIVIYVSIGLIITGVFGATALNLLSTNWIANTLFFLIFVFFAFSFFGYYEITLPSSWANKSNTMADKGGLLGIFFMAFTLALVSFSCTGPIIGSALVQSATSSLGPFVVMLGFSSALAIPFTLFAAFPSWLNSLPRSGSWMNSVKVVLGFLELALALKFLSVADMTMHWNILPYEVFMGLWVIIFAAMTAYLFGLFKFPHDSPMKKLSPTRGFFAVGSLALTVYLISGFFLNDVTKSYNSLKLMSGLAPPSQYNVLLPEAEVDATIKAKYPSFTKCANNLDCFKDYYEGMAYAKENNKPVLLDFTGYGCVNCRKTEEHIWIADKVRDNIQENYVLISLYVDDRKELENILFSEPRQTKLRRVGDMWADFQIVNFEQNSQPLYVMMSPDEKVLAAPRGYKEGVEDYADFLDCGLNTFKNNK